MLNGHKKVLGLTVFLFSILFCGNLLAAEDSLLLDSFEGKVEKGTVDFGAKEGSTVQVEASADEKACGKQSLKLSYKLEEGAYMYCARGYGLDVAGALWEGPAPDKVSWSEYKAISFQLNDTRVGTPNAGPIAFDVKDAGGEIWRFMVTNDQKGWTKITVPLDQFKPRDDWQPANADGNRKLDFPVKSFQWEPKTPGEGVIYFDCVELVK